MNMKQLLILTFCAVISLQFQSPAPGSLKGNLLRCFSQIGLTSKSIAELVVEFATKKDPKQIVTLIGQIAGKLDPLMRECSNPVCTSEATKRCEDQNGKNQCEKYGAIVYPKCAEGYINFGCCVCAKPCPEGFRDDGLYCKKPVAYGRGTGYAWKFGDSFSLNEAQRRCQSENPQGCEQNGLMIYPKCQKGWHSVGCCICSPDCPEGFTDIGVSCRKPESYGRGFGFPMFYDDCPLQKTLGSSLQAGNGYENFTCDQLQGEITRLGNLFVESSQKEDQQKQILELSVLISAATAQWERKEC